MHIGGWVLFCFTFKFRTTSRIFDDLYSIFRMKNLFAFSWMCTRNWTRSMERNQHCRLKRANFSSFNSIPCNFGRSQLWPWLFKAWLWPWLFKPWWPWWSLTSHLCSRTLRCLDQPSTGSKAVILLSIAFAQGKLDWEYLQQGHAININWFDF